MIGLVFTMTLTQVVKSPRILLRNMHVYCFQIQAGKFFMVILNKVLEMGALILLILLFSINTMSHGLPSGIENELDALIVFEENETEEDNGTYRYQLLLWNLYRFQQMKPFSMLPLQERDFLEQLTKSDFLLFQETKWSDQAPSRKMIDGYLKTQPFYHLGFAYPVQQGGVFFPNDDGLGIGTLSKEEPLEWGGFISGVPEMTGDLFAGNVVTGKRHKNALWTTFSLENHFGESKTLLIINIHNLVSRSMDCQQDLINKLIKKIKDHDGPIIFAGDFNTWSFFGLGTAPLMRVITRAGLKKIHFSSPVTFLSASVAFQTEHLFVKGIHIVPGSVTAMNDIELSDHSPVFVEFCLEEDREEEDCLEQ